MIFKAKTANNSTPLSELSVSFLGRNAKHDALKVSVVSACVETIANSIAMLPQYVMEESTKRHLDDHALYSVLQHRPNEMMTPKDFRFAIVAAILMNGNAYVWNYRNRAGEVVERIPIPDGFCEPWYSTDDGRWYYRATNPKTGQTFVLDPVDISHYKAFTRDGIHGISVLERARANVDSAAYMEEYSKSIYANGGRPSGILTVEGDLTRGKTIITDANGEKKEVSIKEAVRMDWDSNYSGPGKAFRTAILDHGLKYQPIAPSNSDAQFIQNKNVTAEDICRFFCVPGYKVGLGKQSYSSNEQNNIEFVTQALQPAVTAMEQEDTYKLLTIDEWAKQGLRVRTNMAALLRGDAKTRAEVEQIYRINGVYSVNDILDLEDRPHVPGGDTRYASLNYIPLELFQELSISRNTQSKGSE